MIKSHAPTSNILAAPCGLNCATCSKYLAYRHNFRRSQCKGCRPENKKCSYLFEKCSGINSSLPGTASAKFCFECDQYPCDQINRMDRRYHSSFGVSVRDNLDFIQTRGAAAFMDEQSKKYRCSKCGDTISIHNRKCFSCDEITRLVEKRTR